MHSREKIAITIGRKAIAIDKKLASASTLAIAGEQKQPTFTAPRPATTPPKVNVTTRPLPRPMAQGRRNFFKFMAAVGGLLGITPFIPFGSFFTAGVGGGKLEEQRVLMPDGTFADVKTFPPDSGAVFPYPRTGDPRLDSEPFRRFMLIRLAKEEGGDKSDVSAFRAYSMICVHLWCLWDYKRGRKVRDPFTGRTITGNIECPCHGSNYRVTDGLAIYGPASLQTPPNNAQPMLDLAIDSEGFIVVKPPTYTVDKNGIIGYGRKVEV